jgi:hypothetical protein
MFGVNRPWFGGIQYDPHPSARPLSHHMFAPLANASQEGCTLLIWRAICGGDSAARYACQRRLAHSCYVTIALQKRRTVARLPAKPSASMRHSAALTAASTRG